MRTLGDGAHYALSLRRIQRLQRLGSARLGLDGLELHPQFGRKTLGIVIPGRLGPVGHPLAHRYDTEFHPLRVGVFFAAGLRAGLVFLAGAFFAGALVAVFTGARAVPAGAALLAVPVLFAVAFAAVFAVAFLAGVFLAAGFSGWGIAGLGAPNFRRTGLSPQISSR